MRDEAALAQAWAALLPQETPGLLQDLHAVLVDSVAGLRPAPGDGLQAQKSESPFTLTWALYQAVSQGTGEAFRPLWAAATATARKAWRDPKRLTFVQGDIFGLILGAAVWHGKNDWVESWLDALPTQSTQDRLTAFQHLEAALRAQVIGTEIIVRRRPSLARLVVPVVHCASQSGYPDNLLALADELIAQVGKDGLDADLSETERNALGDAVRSAQDPAAFRRRVPYLDGWAAEWARQRLVQAVTEVVPGHLTADAPATVKPKF